MDFLHLLKHRKATKVLLREVRVADAFKAAVSVDQMGQVDQVVLEDREVLAVREDLTVWFEAP